MAVLVIKTQKELEAIQRLISKTKINNQFGCWDFTGLLDKKGYGKISYNKEFSAHRVSYLLFNGKIPKGKDVSHDCDNPKCVNPNHLKSASRKENMIGSVVRGRIKCSFEHKQSAFTKKTLNEAIRLKNSGWSYKKISNKLGMSAETIRRHTKNMATGSFGSDKFKEFFV